jgi:hypothetical protein
MSDCSFSYDFLVPLTDDTTDTFYRVTWEWGHDYDNFDGNDIKISIAWIENDTDANPDLLGVAFEVNDATQLFLDSLRFTPHELDDIDFAFSSQLNSEPTFSGWGIPDQDQTYDVAVQFGEVGGDEGIQEVSFIIGSKDGDDLDAGELFSGTDWLFRTQTTGLDGEGSAKTGGTAPDFDCDDDVTFKVEKAISNIVIYADCDGDDVLGNSITKIKFDNFDLLDCDGDGVTAKQGDDDDKLFELTLDQLYEALGAVGKSDCIILGVTIKAGDNDGGFSRGEGQFFDADPDTGIDTGTTTRADHTFEAADPDYTDIWC